MLNEAMGFTVFGFNWPIPEIHGIYNERKRLVQGVEHLKSLLKLVEDSNLCYGLPFSDLTVCSWGCCMKGKGKTNYLGVISPSKLFTFEKVNLLLPEELHMRGCFQILTTHNFQYVIFYCATNCNSIIFDPSLKFFQSIL